MTAPRKSLETATDSEIGWLAGLFEGEGCFTVQRCTRKLANGTEVVYRQPVARIHMTDQDVIAHVYEVVGFGVYWSQGIRRGGLGQKPSWQWAANTFDHYTRLLWKIYPLLGIRRKARSLEVLDEYAFGQTERGNNDRASFAQEIIRALDQR